jgi:hypothetical protein
MTNIQNLAMLSAVIAFAACESNKKSTITEAGNEVVKVRTPTTATAQDSTASYKSVEGVVTNINNGKDGYTAELKSSDGAIYFATISRSNLDNPAEYCSVSKGDQLKVSGEHWKMDEKDQITVRKVQK